MRAELSRKKVRNPWGVSPTATILYLGEVIFSLALALA
jgi:hypothetical protein